MFAASQLNWLNSRTAYILRQKFWSNRAHDMCLRQNFYKGNHWTSLSPWNKMHTQTHTHIHTHAHKHTHTHIHTQSHIVILHSSYRINLRATLQVWGRASPSWGAAAHNWCPKVCTSPSCPVLHLSPCHSLQDHHQQVRVCLSVCVCVCGWVGVWVCVCVSVHVYLFRPFRLSHFKSLSAG